MFSTTNPAKKAGRGILLVEDDALIGQLLTTVLRRDGHVVETTDAAPQALQLAERGGWDLIVTDGKLNGGSGEELARCLRTGGMSPPIILITGSCQVLREPGLFQGILRKPFAIGEFVELVNEILATYGTGAVNEVGECYAGASLVPDGGDPQRSYEAVWR